MLKRELITVLAMNKATIIRADMTNKTNSMEDIMFPLLILVKNNELTAKRAISHGRRPLGDTRSKVK